MKYMATYDWMESFRNTSEWTGATARAMASYPIFAMSMNPMINLAAAWGEVAERSFGRMVAKPDWGIRSMVGPTGQDHLIDVVTVVEKSFGNLIHFSVRRRAPMARKLLVVAPMSGPYATLLRSTITSLLPDADVYVTDWHNARDICQPAPLTLAATAYLAAEDPAAQPRSLTLIGGPVDPDAAATDVTDFGSRVTMGQLEQLAIQRVGFKYKGAGRLVYPGLLQLAGFISMNGERHSKAFQEQIMRVVRGEAADHDAHNRFYDEYLSVMDMTAEFYLSTVERIFKNREIARNEFVVAGKKVDLGAIKRVAVMTVEGEKDDISAPGQCVAALKMLPGLPEAMKTQHLEPDAGHYGIFAGKSWRLNIRPLVLGFIDAHSAAAKLAPVKATPVKAAPVTAAPVKAATVKAATVKTALVESTPAPTAPVKAAPIKAETPGPAAPRTGLAKPAKVAKPVAVEKPAVVVQTTPIAKPAEVAKPAVQPAPMPAAAAPAPVLTAAVVPSTVVPAAAMPAVVAPQPEAEKLVSVVNPVSAIRTPVPETPAAAPQPQSAKLPEAVQTAPSAPLNRPAETPVSVERPSAPAVVETSSPAATLADVKAADTKAPDLKPAEVKPVVDNVVTPMRRSTQS